MATFNRTRPAKIYVDSEAVCFSTRKAMSVTSNDQIVQTQCGPVIQAGRETGQFTMSVVIPGGDRMVTKLRDKQRTKSIIAVQFLGVGDSSHVAHCLLTNLEVTSESADGSCMGECTFTMIQDAESVNMQSILGNLL